MSWHATVGGRKFVATMTALASSSILTWFEKIDGGVYSAVVIATVGAYIVGNVIQKQVLK
jgi:hypothetical protein